MPSRLAHRVCVTEHALATDVKLVAPRFLNGDLIYYEEHTL